MNNENQIPEEVRYTQNEVFELVQKELVRLHVAVGEKPILKRNDLYIIGVLSLAFKNNNDVYTH